MCLIRWQRKIISAAAVCLRGCCYFNTSVFAGADVVVGENRPPWENGEQSRSLSFTALPGSRSLPFHTLDCPQSPHWPLARGLHPSGHCALLHSTGPPAAPHGPCSLSHSSDRNQRHHLPLASASMTAHSRLALWTIEHVLIQSGLHLWKCVNNLKQYKHSTSKSLSN